MSDELVFMEIISETKTNLLSPVRWGRFSRSGSLVCTVGGILKIRASLFQKHFEAQILENNKIKMIRSLYIFGTKTTTSTYEPFVMDDGVTVMTLTYHLFELTFPSTDSSNHLLTPFTFFSFFSENP